MEAKKCDRCGEFFVEKNNNNYGVKRDVHLLKSTVTWGGLKRDNRWLDICNTCNDKLVDFMENK